MNTWCAFNNLCFFVHFSRSRVIRSVKSLWISFIITREERASPPHLRRKAGALDVVGSARCGVGEHFCTFLHFCKVGRSPLLPVGLLQINGGTKSQKSIKNGESKFPTLIETYFEFLKNSSKIEVSLSDNIIIYRSLPDFESGEPISPWGRSKMCQNLVEN